MTEAPRMPAPDADEIDLRAWALALARSWKLIVGLTVLAVVAAGVFTLLQPRLFEATALVVASTPPGGQSGPDPQAIARTAVEVAQSDALIAEVYELVRAELRTIRDRAELKRALRASAARDPRTVRLVVRTQDPAEAAAIANAWARLVVVRVNDVYIGRVGAPASALAQANPGGEGMNPLVVQAQRDAAIADLEELQRDDHNLEGVQRDIQALRDRVARGDGGSVRLEDQLTALFLQLRAFGVSVPERIDLSGQPLGALTADRQALLRSLEDLSQGVAARRAELERRMSRRQADVKALDRQVQGAEFRAGVGLYAAVRAGAVAPSQPVSPRPALNLGVGAALGLLLGLGLATARHALGAEPGEIPAPRPATSMAEKT